MPPDANAPPEKQHNWKWRVTVILWGLIILAPISALVAYRFLMIDGYARQSDISALGHKVDSQISQLTSVVVGLRSDVHESRVDDMQNALFTLSSNVLKDKNDPNREADDCRRFKRLERLYDNLNGSPYQSDVCDEY